IILMDDPAVRAEYEARFFQEAKAAGGLNHPNLVTIHDVGREGDVAYMAMELLEGTELRELMARGRLPLPLALEIMAQAADGLAHAHEHGVVHRDIKPGNIMIVRGRSAKIMDFGIARVRASDVKTQTGAILGSPRYMSPEQVIGQPADRRSDIFSLGVVLHELAAGEPPFTAPTVTQLMHQIATATPRPPSAKNPEVPAMLDLIVAKALEKQPDARYQGAAEFAADLRACLAELAGRKGAQPAANAATVAIGARPAAATGVDVELDKTHSDAATAGGSAISAATATLSGQEPYLSLSRRFDSTEAFLQLAGPAAASATGGASALKRPSLSLSFRIRRALAGARLDSGWLIFAEAVFMAVVLACLIAYSD
ncbi:MAG: serine/threonine-protein kinase, partial [Burkholderiales bacterium]